ncbi:hypothetical protein CQY20_16755 [Mycolicibacterium agri]|uniref:Integral membrane protein n=1 Tax=Mycolicibacterium agri TaxID=36811 RepID=A0A2A7N077_MYCAG|nr:hypothetical protein [Mycolicibacterium agri]PEG37219.1 hypothetical protein CQY20_16755 [Mycolicibacterium agri]GFG54981.1 integral membrane protein [Mycolicibacterium agri]
MRAADQWFLERGLPAVLRPGALVRRLWPRCAPVLAAFAVFMANSIAVVQITGKHTVNIDGEPTRTEWFVLGLLVVVLPVAAAVGWGVSRITSVRARTLVAAVAVLVVVAGGIFGGPSRNIFGNLVFEAVVIALVLALTACGVGAILGWGLRTAADNLAYLGPLLVRALPVVLLTVLVFFNTYVWLMASIVSRPRLWLALAFLGLIAVAFIASSTVDRVRPMLTGSRQAADDDVRLTGTPFEAMPDPRSAAPLSRIERVNVVFVLVTSQVLQVALVAIVAGLIFFVLGLILLSPELLAQWSRNGSADGQILGMTLPVPQSLIQTTMFLAALTFMYVSARAVGDADYRVQFLDHLIDDLRLTLVARSRYRADDLQTGAPADLPRGDS